MPTWSLPTWDQENRKTNDTAPRGMSSREWETSDLHKSDSRQGSVPNHMGVKPLSLTFT